MHNSDIENLLKHFNQISGMEIALLDNKLRPIFTQSGKVDNFCSIIHQCPKCLEACIKSDENCFEKVRQSMTPSIYICPFGIKEAVLPIIQNEKVIACLLCTLGIDKGNEAKEQVVSTAIALSPSLNKEQLKKAVDGLHQFDSEQLDAFFDLLKAIATHVSINGSFEEQTPTIGELIKRFINKNLSQKITLADLSYHIHYSKATLTQHFKREFGLSIVEYMTNKRIELSKKLLITTDKPLSEISALCGFDDTEYFSRTFKKFTSLPPATWRRENK
ncbi:MAG: PocR ligand-binding domain-containing protein [Clostridia bacterium]|nr:PocR ligand-binding domain-containing protein [Clostridia bacterium]